MTDIQQLKEQTDCRVVVEADLGNPKSRGTKAWTWRCPFHNEHKGHSLVVYADGWQCLGKCQTGGDVFTWLQRYRSMTFGAVCRYLGSTTQWQPALPKRQQQQEEVTGEPPDAEWQQKARRIVEIAEAQLWSSSGTRALAYLEGRGLRQAVIHEARLGYIPGSYTGGQMLEGIWVWAGITIPWFIHDVLWAVNVRRPLPKNVEDDKYKLVKGSRRKGGLYWVDHLRLGTTVMFVEGEFDCLLAWQEAKDLVSPVTLGAATNRLHSRWYGDLIYSPQILVVEDADRAGETMGLRLGTLSQRVQRIQVPIGKDLSDYHASQRFHTFRTWVEQQLLPSTTSTTSIPANSLITSTDLQQQNLFDLNPKTSTKSYYERGG